MSTNTDDLLKQLKKLAKDKNRPVTHRKQGDVIIGQIKKPSEKKSQTKEK